MTIYLSIEIKRKTKKFKTGAENDSELEPIFG